DLAAASRDSCDDPQPLSLDLGERAAIRVELRLAPTEILPALNDAIHVFGIKLDAVADALAHFRGDERRSRAQERVVHNGSALGVIEDGLAHQLNGLLRRMVDLLLLRAAHDELRRG